MDRTLTDYETALRLAVDAASPTPTESVALSEAAGRVLREAVRADRDQPPFHRSAMDGFALRADEVRPGARWRIAGRVDAGAAATNDTTPVAAGEARRIATGAPVPAGADCVVPIEQAAATDDQLSVTVDRAKRWQNVHRQASDAAAGDVVIEPGTRLGPQHVGIAAAVGATALVVGAKPRAALLNTGDELRDAGTATEALAAHQIRNSNGPMVEALLERMGATLAHVEHLPDDLDATVAACRRAAALSDLVITTGGVSVGERDHLPAAWARLGAEMVLHGVAIKPGKPVFVATLDGRAILGLPGNPVSVFCTAHLFAWPIVRQMLGQGGTLPWRGMTLAESAKANPEKDVFRAGRGVGRDAVELVPWQGSGDLMHTAAASCWVRLPRGHGELEPGSAVDVLPML